MPQAWRATRPAMRNRFRRHEQAARQLLAAP